MHPDWNVQCCEVRDRAALAMQMHQLSQLSWAQLRQVNHHKNGYEKIERSAIRAPLPPGVTDDVDLIAFRFSEMKPMVGYRGRDRRTFHILYLDHNRRLYDHG